MQTKNDKVKDSEAFKGYLNNELSKHEKTVMIDKLVVGCMVSRQTVYNWLAGAARIPALHKREIEKIIGKKIFFSAETA